MTHRCPRLVTTAASCTALGLIGALWMPSRAPAQGTGLLVAFQSDRDGDSEIWLMNADGSNERPLTQNRTPDATPAWSPDGRTIVYACAQQSSWELCTIDVATGQITQLTHTRAAEFDPRYTPDGTRIVLETYTGGGPADIATMDAAGGTPVRLTTTPGQDDQDPAPSPDGSRIAFATGGDIAVLRTATPQDVERVTTAAAGDSDPIWSARDELAFARRDGRSLDVLVYSFGRRPKRRLTGGEPNHLQPAWTDDSSQVFFVRELAPDRPLRIFRMNRDGSDQTPLTEGGDFDDTEPAPQPQAGAPLRTAVRSWNPVAALSCRSGGPGPNTLIGTGGANCLYGKGGRDRIDGRGGEDKLRGGRGSDRITGGRGRDDLNGKSGDDRIYATDGETDYVRGSKGRDEAWIDDGRDSYKSTVAH